MKKEVFFVFVFSPQSAEVHANHALLDFSTFEPLWRREVFVFSLARFLGLLALAKILRVY